MPLIPFSEYRPDVSDYEAATEKGVLNVVPRGDGFGPFPSLAALSTSLGGACRGAFAAYKTDGSVVVFGATATDLYLLNNTTLGWSRVSLGGVSYSVLSAGDLWQFVQFNNLVIAVQANCVPQVYDISTSTAFANLAGSPPQARYATVVGRFVVLAGMLSNPNRVQWSGLNDVNGPNSWTAGINSSDLQDLADGGFCRGIAGGESGVIMQDTIIRRMLYLPGDPRVFQIEKIAEGLGIYGSYSLVRDGSSIFFYSLKGFHRIDPGGLPAPIGRERVDRTFFTDLDAAQPQLFQGIHDPRSTRILWAYKSVNGATGQFDKALLYDRTLDKFTPLKFSGELLFSMSQPGVTLEGLDSLAPGAMAVTGAASNSLATPVNAAFSTATTGGSLAAGTYYYRVSATNAIGETLASTETSQVVPAGTATNTVTVNWGTVAGATGYKVYGRSTGAELLIASVGAVTTYTDTGAITPAGALPTSNTTGTNAIRIAVASTSALVGRTFLSISGVVGTTEANGNWFFTIVDGTHIDLTGSTFVNAYVSGGTIGGSIETMTQSFDSFQAAIVPELAAFDGNHLLNFFRGPNLEAILETAEQGTDGSRVKMKIGFRPVSDAPVVYGSASRRENQQAAVTAGAESPLNATTGICNMLVDTRYSRFKCRIPAGTVWNFINGVEPIDFKPTGKR